MTDEFKDEVKNFAVVLRADRHVIEEIIDYLTSLQGDSEKNLHIIYLKIVPKSQKLWIMPKLRPKINRMQTDYPSEMDQFYIDS